MTTPLSLLSSLQPGGWSAQQKTLFLSTIIGLALGAILGATLACSGVGALGVVLCLSMSAGGALGLGTGLVSLAHKTNTLLPTIYDKKGQPCAELSSLSISIDGKISLSLKSLNNPLASPPPAALYYEVEEFKMQINRI